MKHPGLFVAFEGSEGAGKSTQVARLVKWLCAAGYQPPVRTREPGATDGLYPDLTVLLDIDPAVGLHRAHLRSALDGPDRIEAEPLPFHARVRAGFLTLAQSAPGRYLVLDAAQPPDVIAAAVRERVATMLPPLPPPVQEA